MNYYSTNHKAKEVSFMEAVIKGLPEDNGLYFPEVIPQLNKSFLDNLSSYTLPEIGFEVARHFVGEDIDQDALKKIVEGTLNFEIPVEHVHNDIHVLELFHGPTMAFKDVGARFLARCLSHFSSKFHRRVTVLVATSGDTGSAVAHGFLGVENVDVVILYPKGKVSFLQEQQLTTLGQNITALEIEGNFDDCQRMVKSAFLDAGLNKEMQLTSANSINMARLLPQSFYYFWAVAQLAGKGSVSISVPSGNYGNITAGLLAKAMGLPVKAFIAASNINDVVPAYLRTSEYSPKPSQQTISNAMDVGDPSNFPRMSALYGKSWEQMKKDIYGYSYDDKTTRETIKSVYNQYNYMLDPHGAVGYLGLKQFLTDHPGTGVFLETAHPAKFKDVVEEMIGPIEIPDRLAQYMDKEKKSILMANQYEELKEFLLKR